MKNILLVVSVIALLISLLAVWSILTNSGNPSLFLWTSWALAFVVGIMSAIYAGRLGRPSWSVALALVTLFVVGSGGAAFVEILVYPDGFFPSDFEAGAVPITVTFAEVLLPLFGLLAALLLRAGRRKLGASVAF